MNKATAYCRVCTYPSDHPEKRNKIGWYDVNCARCGGYRVSDASVAILGDPSRDDGLLNTELKKASVGYWLRQRQDAGAVPVLDTQTIERLANEPWFPTLHDQRENLLRLIGSRSAGPGERVSIDNITDQYIVGARTPAGLAPLFERLRDENLLGFTDIGSGPVHVEFSVILNFGGWLEYEDLSRGKTKGRSAFMAMPFNKPDLDDEWLPALRTAVGETGFTLRRVDDEPKPGLIDVRMRVQISQARFLIVELTHANQGAYWEAGFAEGLGKPVIYTCCEGHDAHFDVDHSLRVVWNPVNLKPAIDRVKATIRNELPDALPES